MVDIPVTFGTNAAAVAKEIEAAAAATAKASTATERNTVASKANDAEKGKLSKATVASAAALKAEAGALDTHTAALHRSAAAVRAHAAAGDITTSEHLAHNHAGLSQAARVGGFRHEMHAFEFAEGAIGGGAAGMAMGGLALGALVLDRFTKSLEKSIEAVSETVHADREYAEALTAARAEMGRTGLGAVKEFGDQIIDITSRGGLRDLAEKFAKDGNDLHASMNAAMLASRIFPGHEADAMRQANDAGSLTGVGIDKLMQQMEGMPLSTLMNGHAAAMALTSMHRGMPVDSEEFDMSAGRTSDSTEAMNVRRANSLSAQTQVGQVGMIGMAPGTAASDMSAALQPMQQHAKKTNEILQKNLDESIKIRETLNFQQRSWDNLMWTLGNPSKLGNIDDATRALHNDATRGPAP